MNDPEDPKPRSGRHFELPIRRLVLGNDPERFRTETDDHHVADTISLNTARAGLVFLDVWRDHPNKGWLERAKRNLTESIVPLVELARETGIQIFHLPSAEGREAIAPEVGPEPADIVVEWSDGAQDDDVKLDQALKELGIDTLLYAGWAANICLLEKPGGMRNMCRNYGYSVIVVRDATIARESQDSLEGEWFKKAALFEIERKYGPSTTLADLRHALLGAESI